MQRSRRRFRGPAAPFAAPFGETDDGFGETSVLFSAPAPDGSARGSSSVFVFARRRWLSKKGGRLRPKGDKARSRQEPPKAAPASANGASVASLGREPQERESPPTTPSPNGATEWAGDRGRPPERIPLRLPLTFLLRELRPRAPRVRPGGGRPSGRAAGRGRRRLRVQGDAEGDVGNESRSIRTRAPRPDSRDSLRPFRPSRPPDVRCMPATNSLRCSCSRYMSILNR